MRIFEKKNSMMGGNGAALPTRARRGGSGRFARSTGSIIPPNIGVEIGEASAGQIQRTPVLES